MHKRLTWAAHKTKKISLKLIFQSLRHFLHSISNMYKISNISNISPSNKILHYELLIHLTMTE